MNKWNHCRFCAGTDIEDKFRFGIRHYAHALCGMQRFGPVEFFKKLATHELMRFPYFVAKDWGAAVRIPGTEPEGLVALRAELDRRQRAEKGGK